MKLHKTKKGSFLTAQLYIYGRVFDCLVDTGSPVTIIHNKTIKPDSKDKRETIRGVDGSKTIVRKREVSVDVVGEAVTINSKIVLMDLSPVIENWKPKVNLDGIIGMDIITKTDWLCL